jgi:PmbA protein
MMQFTASGRLSRPVWLHAPFAVYCITMPDPQFSHSAGQLSQIAKDVLDYAMKRGAGAAEVEVTEGTGQTVTVRQGAVETIEYNRDKGIGVTVYIGKQRGHASTTDFSPQAVHDTVDAALSIARFTAADDCAGLADEDMLARDIPDLDLWHPWALPVERAIDLARECEEAGFAVDRRLTNSEGATVSTQGSHFVYGNTHGFLAGFPSSRHGIWCALVAGKNDEMQRDDWYETSRDPGELPAAAGIGRRAGERAVRRLAARKIPTRQAPVLFEAAIASSLVGHFVSAVSGGNLYRKSSFLPDCAGQAVFAPLVHISEQPHVRRGLASTAFDEEGVATRPREVVKDGVVQGYFLGSYSARKLGLRSTGNAGGNHNLQLRDTGIDFAGLLKTMGTGLLVTELLGQGVNSVTGDYSRGAAGFWVERGEIAYPVQEITIAGNLKDMFRGISAVGTDVVRRGSRYCGSVLVERMTIAGD